MPEPITLITNAIQDDYKAAVLVFKGIHDMATKYPTELLAGKKISKLGLCSANRNKLLNVPRTTRKHSPQELSVFMDQLYGTNYQTILGPQQTTAPSKEKLKHTFSN